MRGYCSSWGHSVVAIVVVERFNNSHCMDCHWGSKKWPLEVWLCLHVLHFYALLTKPGSDQIGWTPLTLSLTFRQKSFKLGGKKEKKMDEQIDYTSSLVWIPPQNRILQLISKINHQWLSAFFAHTGRGCDFHEPIWHSCLATCHFVFFWNTIIK